MRGVACRPDLGPAYDRMRFRLRYLQHDLELNEGTFAVGRNASCQLSLDDPLVSRRHALFEVVGGHVSVEDLNSRNGVIVNGARIDGKVPLTVGDRILIGSQELTLLSGGVAEKALAMGKAGEAERLLASALADVIESTRAGRPLPPTLVDQAAKFSAKLATATGKGGWADYVIELYQAQKRPCPAHVIDELYNAMRKVTAVDLHRLRSYVAMLRQNLPRYGPAERFLFQRLEGLERLAALR